MLPLLFSFLSFFLETSATASISANLSCTNLLAGYLCCPTSLNTAEGKDFLHDPQNCGSCGLVCPSTRQYCNYGSCVSGILGSGALEVTLCNRPVIQFPGLYTPSGEVNLYVEDFRPEVTGGSLSYWVNILGNSTPQVYLSFIGKNGKCLLQAGTSLSSLPLPKLCDQNADFPIGTAQWAHVVLVYNQSSHVLSIYLDGHPAESFGTTFTQIDRILLGAPFSSPSVSTAGALPFSGQMAQIAIWDIELSGNEIGNLYSSGNGVSGVGPDPYGYLLVSGLQHLYLGKIVGHELVDYAPNGINQTAGRSVTNLLFNPVCLRNCSTPCPVHDACCPISGSCLIRNNFSKTCFIA